MARHTDRLPGGLADKSKPSDFNAKELARGIAVELEHTKDRRLAREIAMDHLKEDPRYYSKLKKVHKEGLGRTMNLAETVDLLSRVKTFLEYENVKQAMTDLRRIQKDRERENRSPTQKHLDYIRTFVKGKKRKSGTPPPIPAAARKKRDEQAEGKPPPLPAAVRQKIQKGREHAAASGRSVHMLRAKAKKAGVDVGSSHLPGVHPVSDKPKMWRRGKKGQESRHYSLRNIVNECRAYFAEECDDIKMYGKDKKKKYKKPKLPGRAGDKTEGDY